MRHPADSGPCRYNPLVTDLGGRRLDQVGHRLAHQILRVGKFFFRGGLSQRLGGQVPACGCHQHTVALISWHQFAATPHLIEVLNRGLRDVGQSLNRQKGGVGRDQHLRGELVWIWIL
jgi:hypothetical protein